MSGTPLGSPSYYQGQQSTAQSFNVDPNRNLWTQPTTQSTSPLDWARMSYEQYPNSQSFPLGINPDYDFSRDLQHIPNIRGDIGNYSREALHRTSFLMNADQSNLWWAPDMQQQWQQQYAPQLESLNTWLSGYDPYYETEIARRLGYKAIPRPPKPDYGIGHGEGYQGGDIAGQAGYGGQVGSGDEGTAVA